LLYWKSRIPDKPNTKIIEKIWTKFFKIGLTSIEAMSDSFSFKTNGFIHIWPSYQPDSSYSTFSDFNLLNTWFQPRYNLIEINKGIDRLPKKLKSIYFKSDDLKYILPEEIIRRIEQGEKIALTDGEVSAVLLPSDEYYYELYNRGRGSEL